MDTLKDYTNIEKGTENENLSTEEEEKTHEGNVFNELWEKIFTLLPIADTFRCQFVSKRWESMIRSPTFSAKNNEINRRPWFLMMDFYYATDVVYDMDISDWRKIPLQTINVNSYDEKPVASSGSLICCKTRLDGCPFMVCNPLTGLTRVLPKVENRNDGDRVFMSSKTGSWTFTVFVVGLRSESILQIVAFLSDDNAWTTTTINLPQGNIINNMAILGVGDINNEVDNDFNDNSGSDEEDNINPNDNEANNENDDNLGGSGDENGEAENNPNNINGFDSDDESEDDDEWVSKKDIAGVTTIGSNGETMLYVMIGSSGVLIGYNSNKRTAVSYPTLLPHLNEFEFDLVEFGGRLFLVVLGHIFPFPAIVSVKIFVLDPTEEAARWKFLSTMPSSISNFSGIPEFDINCAGHGDNIMICLSSASAIRVVMYEPNNHTWSVLPTCFDSNGNMKAFVSAYAFVPMIEPK